MRKPKFESASFKFNDNGKWYLVLFRQMLDKSYYQIDVKNDMTDKSLIESFIEREVATKTTALFYLCKALKLSTANIH